MKEIPKSPERLAILEKIAQYEREGRFDEDVENDPPSRVLLPEEIEYADRLFPAECRRTAAFGAAGAEAAQPDARNRRQRSRASVFFFMISHFLSEKVFFIL